MLRSGNHLHLHMPRYAKRWRHIGIHRARVMKKPDGSKARWIIRQKRAETWFVIKNRPFFAQLLPVNPKVT